MHPTSRDDIGRLARVASLVVAAAVAVGCGSSDDSGSPPEFGATQISCENVEGDEVDRPVVREVGVEVSDPDRDLVTENGQICGTLDGLPIAMGDSDADGLFTWSPSEEVDGSPCGADIGFGEAPIACDGTFELRVTATDSSGNETELETEIEKGGGS